MGIEITTDLSRITQAQIVSIYGAVGFGSADDYAGRTGFLNGLFGPGISGFFAFDTATGELVGFLRAFSDNVMVAWIAEVCVLPSHQRQGIGRRLMEAASHRFEDLALYAEPFTQNVEFFNKCGLRTRPVLVACARGPVKRAKAA